MRIPRRLSAILYHGPSQLDPSVDVVAIVTGLGKRPGRNSKTGNMPQVWILRADMEPNTAVKEGCDAAVCGDCPFAQGQGCYVVTHQAPLSVFRAWRRGSCHGWEDGAIMHQLARATVIRVGAYGDPLAVPAHVWGDLASWAPDARLLGYTHSWRLPHAPAYRRWFMASVEDIYDQQAAVSLGWRTFRVGLKGDQPNTYEKACPAMDKGISCAQCKACDGLARGYGDGRFIEVHGARARKAAQHIG